MQITAKPKKKKVFFDHHQNKPLCNSAAAKVCNLDAKVDHI